MRTISAIFDGTRNTLSVSCTGPLSLRICRSRCDASARLQRLDHEGLERHVRILAVLQNLPARRTDAFLSSSCRSSQRIEAHSLARNAVEREPVEHLAVPHSVLVTVVRHAPRSGSSASWRAHTADEALGFLEPERGPLEDAVLVLAVSNWKTPSTGRAPSARSSSATARSSAGPRRGGRGFSRFALGADARDELLGVGDADARHRRDLREVEELAEHPVTTFRT
ncbi:MAG: hypothetical protein U1E73_05170 [Planctomycetota bacterium]